MYTVSVARRISKIHLDAVLFAFYIAITPIHQALSTGRGTTINKYVSLLVMVSICFHMIARRGRLFYDKALVRSIAPFVCWIAITIIWSYSRANTVTSLFSTFSYILFTVICCSWRWNEKEKRLFHIALIGACVFYSFVLIGQQANLLSKRSTFSLGLNGSSSDQNLLSANLGIAILFAINIFSLSSKRMGKLLSLAAALFIFTGIIATGSRGALIAVIISSLCYFLQTSRHRKRKRGALVLILLCFFLLIIYLTSSDSVMGDYLISRYTSMDELKGASGRTDIWNRYLSMLGNWFWGIAYGFGYGAHMTAYGAFYETKWPHAVHNDLLAMVCSAGIVSVILIGRFVAYMVRKAKKDGNALGLSCIVLMIVAGLSVDMFGSYGWWNAMIFSYICAGNLYAKTEDNEMRLES